MSAAQAAFAYVLANPGVSSCVFGTTNLANSIEVIESSELQLSPSSMSAIRQAFQLMDQTIST
ncbi:MAG: hypothetical protein FD171_1475 [Actinobacteria bacterium]|nr:MAG: hypothetical protein FD171_1475 [Actinomycetota bacterium]